MMPVTEAAFEQLQSDVADIAKSVMAINASFIKFVTTSDLSKAQKDVIAGLGSAFKQVIDGELKSTNELHADTLRDIRRSNESIHDIAQLQFTGACALLREQLAIYAGE